ncbi:MAG: hypothetical protein ABFD62_05610 [Syntrophaceae bacterium]
MREIPHLKTGNCLKGIGGNARLAALLALAGAGIPWVAYDRLIADPADFWTFRGAVFMVIAALGVISVVFAWAWGSGDGPQGTGEQDRTIL